MPGLRAQNTKGEVVDQLGQLLVEAGMQNVLPLPKARVPVVKFVVGDNGTKVAPCPCSVVPNQWLAWLLF